MSSSPLQFMNATNTTSSFHRQTPYAAAASTGRPINAAVGQQRPGHASTSCCKCHRHDLEGPPRQELREPEIFLRILPGSPQHSNRSDDEKCAASSGRPAWRLAQASACPRSNPVAAPVRSKPQNRAPTEKPSRPLPSPRSRSPDDPDARDGLKPLARLVRAVLRLDIVCSIDPISVLHRLKLRRQHMTLARASIGKRASFYVRHDREQFLDPLIALCGHDAEFGQMRPQRVDRLRVRCRNQQIARADAASTDPAVRPI